MPDFDKESKRIEPQHRELVPHVQRDARVSAQTAPSTTVDRGDMMQAVGDYLKSKTFNGFPINVQGSDIFVARAAFAVTEVARGGVQQATPVTPPELARPVVVAPGVGCPVPGGLVSTGLRSTGLVSTGLQSSGLTTGRVGEVRQDTPAKPSLKGLLKTDPTIHRPNMRRHSDLTTLGHTVVPVRLKRGDGRRTILAYLDMTSGFVLKGAEFGEPTTVLPATNAFYDALGAGAEFAFAFRDATNELGPKILVLDGEINDDFPAGMGGDDYILSIVGDSEIWAGWTYDTTTFDITSRFLDIGTVLPDNTWGTVYKRLGKIWFVDTVMYFRNTHCGDIDMMPMTTFEDGVAKISWIPQCGDSVEWVT